MADPQCLREYVDRLSVALTERGLKVKVTGYRVTAINVGAHLVQSVELQDVDGVLMWCWLWLGPRLVVRGAPRPEPDVEPFSPGDEIDYAALRIANVVAGTRENTVIDATNVQTLISLCRMAQLDDKTIAHRTPARECGRY
ncbi:hypothetical protein [Actinoallomurus sp. NPDC052274]|uniref:hypothetical protein n=1 Tax=Actinoallomurus sp. NPDC052274 TaxID=3155420 RepID=UPI0034445D00